MICFAGGELLSRYGVLLGLGLLEELACAIFEYDEELLTWSNSDGYYVAVSLGTSRLTNPCYPLNFSWFGGCFVGGEVLVNGRRDYNNPWRTLKIGGCFELLPVCLHDL